MGQLTRLGRNCVLNDGLEARLIQTLMCPILKYGAESWTLKKQQAESIGGVYEMRCYDRATRISLVEHTSNDKVLQRLGQSTSLQGRMLPRKLRYSRARVHI